MAGVVCVSCIHLSDTVEKMLNLFDDGHSGNIEGDAAKSVIVTSCALIFAAHSKANKHILPDEIVLFPSF